jgi:drug/metabolite transporter (DMT)-like permease
LAAAAGVLFIGALVISWTEGAEHLTLQLLAMALGLVACLLAAMAAGFGRRGRPS